MPAVAGAATPGRTLKPTVHTLVQQDSATFHACCSSAPPSRFGTRSLGCLLSCSFLARRHEEGEPLFDFNGFVGRAYEAGYDCLDEGELARVCGVKLR